MAGNLRQGPWRRVRHRPIHRDRKGALRALMRREPYERRSCELAAVELNVVERDDLSNAGTSSTEAAFGMTSDLAVLAILRVIRITD